MRTAVIIVQDAFHRFIVCKADDHNLAWSGSAWVSHEQGVPTGAAQVSNFAKPLEAIEYAEKCGFMVKSNDADHVVDIYVNSLLNHFKAAKLSKRAYRRMLVALVLTVVMFGLSVDNVWQAHRSKKYRDEATKTYQQALLLLEEAKTRFDAGKMAAHKLNNECPSGTGWEPCGASSRPTNATTITIMHKPHDGCPKNFREAPDFFTEKDDTKRDACIMNGTTRTEIDILYSGESVQLPLFGFNKS